MKKKSLHHDLIQKSQNKWHTREVLVGNVGVGGGNPIRIQSMTTAKTSDINATVEQIIKLANMGCEIARVTVQGKKEARACEGIKNTLLKKGYSIPLVADIHFYPPAAMEVVEFVDKVRINPGNYLDKRATFQTLIYDDVSYQNEIDRIEEKFTPLVEKCKRLKRSMRIGTNHGSLSDRIMNRYGDTAFGMVESALEFARVCRKLDFHDIIFSMKSSNPKVMIEAYRLLVASQQSLGWDYPLHLGVTEAGNNEDGRIKSAVGIGSLLLEGIGDTIRVSLTEDPWNEIDPCKRLISQCSKAKQNKALFPRGAKIDRQTQLSNDVFPSKGSVFLRVSKEELLASTFFADIGLHNALLLVSQNSLPVDAIIINAIDIDPVTTPILQQLDQKEMRIFVESDNTSIDFPFRCTYVHQKETPPNGKPFGMVVNQNTSLESISESSPDFLLVKVTSDSFAYATNVYSYLQANHLSIPVILEGTFWGNPKDILIEASCKLGYYFIEEMFESISIAGDLSIQLRKKLCFDLMQACRIRFSKTDFIACPGCGRTLFNLQEVTKKIQEETDHLPNVKIAIMGCIVNGIGEMADADFGYVGSKTNMIDLYVGKKCVEKNIEFSQAVIRLIALIKAHGKWVERKDVIQKEKNRTCKEDRIKRTSVLS